MSEDHGPADDDRVEDWTIGAVPDWGPACLNDLVESLLSNESPFPCTFAVAAAKKRTLRFGFVDSIDDQGRWEPLVEVISRYLATYQDGPRDTSLVVFFRPQPTVRSIEAYHGIFWSVLRFLHERDPKLWPAEVPEDPNHPLWEFSFNGESIFVVCNTPAHTRRRSRYSPGFVITFQPRWVFEGLEADSPRGVAARRVIRKRLREFDGTAPSPALGNYGDPANREWRQYFLPDRNTDAEMGCPFHTPAPRVERAPAPVCARPGATAERRRALHRRLLAEAGLAARRGSQPTSTSRPTSERASRGTAAAHRVWLAHRAESNAPGPTH
ncbi:MAG TPA: YqcI/YcgG family protein [Pseudonocardia sp.]